MVSNGGSGNGFFNDNGYGIFQHSKNYLNWLFFCTTARDLDSDGEDEPVYDGAALPDKSRFYYAKKALRTVGKLSSNKALFAIYNFISTPEGSSNVQPLGEVVATDGKGENVLPGAGFLTVDGTTYTITTHINGSTYLDDVAAYF